MDSNELIEKEFEEAAAGIVSACATGYSVWANFKDGSRILLQGAFVRKGTAPALIGIADRSKMEFDISAATVEQKGPMDDPFRWRQGGFKRRPE